MTTNEFAEKCNVTPQIVRSWIRSGKLRKDDSGIWLTRGYVLLPHLTIKKGDGERRITKGQPGVSGRTVRNWVAKGLVVKGPDGCYYVKDGLCLENSYRPYRRR